MKALITGVTGFVGQYLAKELTEQGIDVFGTSRKKNPSINIYQLDLLDKAKIINLLRELRPTYIFHLAGMSNVKESWLTVSETMDANTIKTANLLEAVRKVDQGTKVITIGSSEEYGSVKDDGEKIKEDTPLVPVSPYGISKAAVSMLSKLYHNAHELEVIHLRPFNHIGPGQKLGFVTSDFAYKVAQLNITENTLKVGNLSAVRDFTDVRDIAHAYYLTALKGRPGEVYNICSGTAVEIKEILNFYTRISEKNNQVVIDPNKMRAIDTPVFIGCNDKFSKETGWQPKISLEKSLSDIYQYWTDFIDR